jgi:uncharacterized protein
MAPFDPISAVVGGALIGVASVLLMVLTGRIAGISGIFGGLLTIGSNDRDWRLAFIAGLILAPLLSGLVGYPLPLPQMPDSWALIALAGVLIGFGSRLAGGCTSGHGICGLARFSARSLAATVIFTLTAVVVVAVMRHGF